MRKGDARKKERLCHTRMQTIAKSTEERRQRDETRRWDMASILEYALSRKLRRSFVPSLRLSLGHSNTSTRSYAFVPRTSAPPIGAEETRTS